MKVLALLLVCVGVSLASPPVQKTCDEDPDPGMCLAYIPSFYYDRSTGTCKKFIYGGCQGNGNRYKTEEDCLKHCGGRDRADVDVCELEAETGMCRAYMPRYFYNSKTGQCEKFIYGGCGGNGNNFRTLEACHNQCAAKKQDRADVDVCELEAVTGMCKARKPRYFYNSRTGQCELFIYGGCGGNGNNFRTQEECHNRCAAKSETEVCTLEPETGPCRAYFEMYFYNSKTGKCEMFVYGGCKGNDNRFGTEEECYGKCGQVRRASNDACQLDPAIGPCKGYFTRYFFNKDSGICEEFIYGGCGGNENNFRSLDECTSACGSA